MKLFMRRFLRERSAVAGLILCAIIVVAVVIGPFLDPLSPIAIAHPFLGHPLAPSLAHPLGTDLLGRDNFTRALYGGRVSLLVGFTAMIVAVVVGTLYGAISGAFGGAVDAVMMRAVDALLSFPTFFLVITVEALTNQFTLVVIILVIGLLSWMGVARLVRGEVLSLRERDFVEAARAVGASRMRIVIKHLIPNALAPVVVASTLAIGDNILTESGLSFLGLGIQVPTPSWGNMLQDSLAPSAADAPWLILVPGILIVLTLLGFSLLGEGIRVAFDRSIAQTTADAMPLDEPEIPRTAAPGILPAT